MNHQLRDRVSVHELLTELKQASRDKDLTRGKELHLRAAQAGHLTNKYVAAGLVSMYGKTGIMSDAWKIFQTVLQPDTVLWNNLILGYLENGEIINALDCVLEFFTIPGHQPDSVTFVAVFKSYGRLASHQSFKRKFCLEKGVEAHKRAQELGLHMDKFVATNLIEMYSKCGLLAFSRRTFNCMAQRSVVTWTALILGYIANGQSHVALDLFMSADCQPDGVFFVAGFKACVGLVIENRTEKLFCLEKALFFHEKCRRLGLHGDLLVGNNLIDMYSRLGSMKLALETFSLLTKRDNVSWNTLINGYVENGEPFKALELFLKMTCKRDSLSFVAAVRACTALSSLNKNICLERGSAVHELASKEGLDTECVVANGLVVMYSRFNSMLKAKLVFNKVKWPNVVLWTNLILGYVENGEHLAALDVFSSMDLEPDSVSLIAGLRACVGLLSEKTLNICFILEKVIEIHRRAIQYNLDSDVFLSNTLIEVYSRCGCITLPKVVFEKSCTRNVVSWNNLIQGYVENGKGSLAMEIVVNLGCEPDCFTYAYALKSCSSLITEEGWDKRFSLEKGTHIHQKLQRLGLDQHILVSNALVEMYSKCGNMSLAVESFKRMPQRDVVSYNILMLGYVESGMYLEAIGLFKSMECEPSPGTFVTILRACGAVSSVAVGQTIHAHVRRMGLEQSMAVGTSLVDFYGKCGMPDAAEEVFSRLQSPDIVSWNALIAGYSSLGETAKVLALVKRLQDSGLEMNETTFLLVLKACSHAGDVEEGKKQFESIAAPTPEHYACLIDMFGRANRLDEAVEVVRNMPFEANNVVWRTLLGAYTR